MQDILSRISEYGIAPSRLFVAVGGILVLFLVIGILCKLFLGKDSLITGSISTSIAILFVYSAFILLDTFALPFPAVSLPFAKIQDHQLVFFSYSSGITNICVEVFSMASLAFLASLIEFIIPKGKKLPLWALFRIIMIVLTVVGYTILSGLLNTWVTPRIQQYLSVSIISSVLLLLSTGSLQFLVGIVFSAANPIIAGLFSFFFVSFLGKKILKSLIITALFSGIVLLLGYFGIHGIPVTSEVLPVYAPFALAASAVWYFIWKLI